MCLVPKQFPEVPKGWESISPPQTPEELYEKCIALRKRIDKAIEEEKQMQEMIKEHEYMGMLKDVVK